MKRGGEGDRRREWEGKGRERRREWEGKGQRKEERVGGEKDSMMDKGKNENRKIYFCLWYFQEIDNYGCPQLLFGN